MHPDLSFTRSSGNETAFITQVALEQKVDAIFVITGKHGGFDETRRALNDRERRRWERQTKSRSYQKQLEEHKALFPAMQQAVNQRLREINDERKRNGQPPRVLDERWGVYSQASDLGISWAVDHPGFEPVVFREPRKLERYFRGVVDELYTDVGAEKPSLNVILLLAANEKLSRRAQRSLDEFTQFFNGENRIIRGLAEIREARSN